MHFSSFVLIGGRTRTATYRQGFEFAKCNSDASNAIDNSVAYHQTFLPNMNWIWRWTATAAWWMVARHVSTIYHLISGPWKWKCIQFKTTHFIAFSTNLINGSYEIEAICKINIMNVVEWNSILCRFNTAENGVFSVPMTMIETWMWAAAFSEFHLNVSGFFVWTQWKCSMEKRSNHGIFCVELHYLESYIASTMRFIKSKHVNFKAIDVIKMNKLTDPSGRMDVSGMVKYVVVCPQPHFSPFNGITWFYCRFWVLLINDSLRYFITEPYYSRIH